MTFLAATLISCAAAKSAPAPPASLPVSPAEPPPQTATATPTLPPTPTPLPTMLPLPLPRTPAKIEGHLAHAICAGAPRKDAPRPPRKASCCYPAKEVLVRPIRAAYPALRRCFEARTKREAEGRVAFAFRIEQDGTIAHICASEGSAMDDEPAVHCMVEAMRKVRFPSMTNEERDFCGLITMTYPVIFEP